MRLASRQFGVGLPVSLTPPLPSALWQGTHLTEKIFLPSAGLPFGTGLAVSVESANAANAAHAIAMLPPQATKRMNARRAMWRFPLFISGIRRRLGSGPLRIALLGAATARVRALELDS